MKSCKIDALYVIQKKMKKIQINKLSKIIEIIHIICGSISIIITILIKEDNMIKTHLKDISITNFKPKNLIGYHYKDPLNLLPSKIILTLKIKIIINSTIINNNENLNYSLIKSMK